MNDQAARLRDLMRGREFRVVREDGERVQPRVAPPKGGSEDATSRGPALAGATREGDAPRTIAVSSGSGGVGKSVVSLHLARSLAALGRRVCLIDANAGMSHLAMLMGLNDWTGADDLPPGGSLDEASHVDGRVTAVFGMHARIAGDVGEAAAAETDRFLAGFEDVVIDAGVRTAAGVGPLLLEADAALLLTTPEPIPLAAAYASIRTLAAAGRTDVSIALNRCPSPEAGRRVAEQLTKTASTFLRRRPAVVAALPEDEAVRDSVRGRTPARVTMTSPFAASLRDLATRLSGVPAMRGAA